MRLHRFPTHTLLLCFFPKPDHEGGGEVLAKAEEGIEAYLL